PAVVEVLAGIVAERDSGLVLTPEQVVTTGILA
ncbi:MAG: hypothetical protein QOJ12_1413, partial [Thermoleophilales bacterium]|nr:hypothetical protein [Thermoleophilales bacterium]